MPRPLPSAWLFLIAFLLFASAAHAASPSDADIERLLKASRAQDMLAAIGPQMEAMQQQQFQQLVGGGELSDDQRAEAERIRERSSQIMRESLSWEQMRPLYIDVYRQTFTREEVRAMTKFYESPTGKAMLDKTPLLMQNLMTAMQQKVLPMIESLKNELDGASAGQTAPSQPAGTVDP